MTCAVCCREGCWSVERLMTARVELPLCSQQCSDWATEFHAERLMKLIEIIRADVARHRTP